MSQALNLTGTALLLGGIVLLVGSNAATARKHLPELGLKRSGAGTLLGGRNSSFTLQATRGTITLRGGEEPVGRELALSIVVNGNARPLTIGRQDLRAS